MWSASARAADVIVVMFTPAYKARFTAALRMEAELIYKLYMQGTAVYVFESETMAAAEVRVNLQDGVKTMGSVTEWWSFCSKSATGAAEQVSGRW